MDIKEVKSLKLNMEQSISASLKEFEKSTGLQISSISFVRRSECNEVGTENDFK